MSKISGSVRLRAECGGVISPMAGDRKGRPYRARNVVFIRVCNVFTGKSCTTITTPNSAEVFKTDVSHNPMYYLCKRNKTAMFQQNRSAVARIIIFDMSASTHALSIGPFLITIPFFSVLIIYLRPGVHSFLSRKILYNRP